MDFTKTKEELQEIINYCQNILNNIEKLEKETNNLQQTVFYSNNIIEGSKKLNIKYENKIKELEDQNHQLSLKLYENKLNNNKISFEERLNL